jgi:hypothetical protein
MTLTTDVLIKAQGVVKGSVKPGNAVKFRTAGGVFVFRDGSLVQERANGLRPPQVGRLYVFFLKWNNDAYEFTRATQGMFEIKNGLIVPAETRHDPLADRYRGMSTVSFLRELRSAPAN